MSIFQANILYFFIYFIFLCLWRPETGGEGLFFPEFVQEKREGVVPRPRQRHSLMRQWDGQQAMKKDGGVARKPLAPEVEAEVRRRFARLPTFAEALKDRPHIYEQVVALWGSIDLLEYIDDVLVMERGREGRAGLDEGCIQELMILRAAFIQHSDYVFDRFSSNADRERVRALASQSGLQSTRFKMD